MAPVTPESRLVRTTTSTRHTPGAPGLPPGVFRTRCRFAGTAANTLRRPLRHYNGTPFEQPVERFRQTLRGGIYETQSQPGTTTIQRFASISLMPTRWTPPCLTPSSSRLPDRVVEFQYKKLGERNYQKRAAEAGHLACASGSLPRTWTVNQKFY
jgi:hypothetical protein